MLAGVKSTRYSALVTQDDDWSARIARLVAREIRRYRESQQPRMSVQRLADRTAELDMAIPRSVLANLESGRRETVSVAEVLALAAALNVSPIELICPVGFDKETEMLPGRMMEPLSAMRWFTGEWKLDIDDDGVWTMRTPGSGEHGSAYLLRYHDELISRLHSQEARAREALRAVAEAVGQEADERARGAGSSGAHRRRGRSVGRSGMGGGARVRRGRAAGRRSQIGRRARWGEISALARQTPHPADSKLSAPLPIKGRDGSVLPSLIDP